MKVSFLISQYSNLTTPKAVSVTSGYSIVRNVGYSVGKLVTLSIGILCPAGYNYGNYLHIATASVAPKAEMTGVALVIYGLKTFATAVKVTTDGRIHLYTTYDIAQVASGNNCDTSFNITYASN